MLSFYVYVMLMLMLFHAMLCSVNVMLCYVTTAIIPFVKLKISCLFESN